VRTTLVTKGPLSTSRALLVPVLGLVRLRGPLGSAPDPDRKRVRRLDCLRGVALLRRRHLHSALEGTRIL
jgi:hypothetical protein